MKLIIDTSNYLVIDIYESFQYITTNVLNKRKRLTVQNSTRKYKRTN